MNCQDNSRLKVPLPELCRTTDIGCVPKTDGKPQCAPEPDQLPFSYDPNTKTLWIFECDSRQWVSFGKFSLSELGEVSLDNIRNICSLLKIPVFYNPGGGTIEGHMALGDFAEELMKCVNLKHKVAVLSGGTVSFSVEGLDNLSPLYVKYENMTVSGKGTQADPLVISAQSTPTICALPEKTQAQLEAATKVSLGACMDSQNVRVPYPEQPKNYTISTQAEVDSAVSRFLVAVIGGQHRRIPFPEEPCEYDTVTAEAATKANQADLIACVNGEEVKFSLKDLINIIKGDDPVADLNYSCVPVTTTTPSGAPDPKVGPFLLDGDGKSLWIWSCGDRRWIKVTGGSGGSGEDTPHPANWSTVASTVSNKCTGVTYDAWYADGDTLKPTRLTGTQLGTILKDCLNLVDSAGLTALRTELIGLINALGARVTALENGGGGGGGGNPVSITGGTGINVSKTTASGVDTYTIKSTVPTVAVTAGNNVTVTKTTSSDGATVSYAVSSTGGGGGTGGDGEVAEVFKGVGGAACVSLATSDPYVIYQARDNTLLYGTASGTIGGSASIGTYRITNPFNVPSLLQLDIDYQLTAATMPAEGSNPYLPGGSIGSIVHLGENRNIDYLGLVQNGPIVSIDECMAIINLTYDDRINALFRNSETNQIENVPLWMARSNLLRYTTVLPANGTKTIYLNHWESLYATWRGGTFLWHVKAIANATVFKNVRTN